MKLLCKTLLLLAAALLSFSPYRGKTKRLFNGKDLRGWETYIGPAYDTTENKFAGPPQGVNADPLRIFSVVRTDGKAAIRISGERFGGVSTLEEFENYHLRLEFKWGKEKWRPKNNGPRDSGVLYHATGPHGADGNFWMRSHEFQIQEGDCGDYWGVAGGIADIPARKTDSNYVYDPAAPLQTFSAATETGRHCIKFPDAEKPSGEWNTIDLYCMGDTSVHIVNNKVNMILYNLCQTNGIATHPMTKGKIQIQSEGAEVFYRNISIESIGKIPDVFLQPDN